MKKKILIAGAGGFIGGHLANYFNKSNNCELICADIKPLEFWFQIFDQSKNYSFDLKDYNNCLKATEGVDYVFNMACNMGGMGFIENNKADCMISVLINANLLRSSVQNKVKKYLFSSSACVYNSQKQKKTFIPGLKEADAYPADPEDGYGWEKLFSERMCRHFNEDYGLDVRVVRYHNVYGPLGTYDGGREKAPAALCRKVINSNGEIEVYGDGKQTRSFLYIDECVEGIRRLMESDCKVPLNIGSDEIISINDFAQMIIDISEKEVVIKNIDVPQLGVRGRNSDNTLIKEKLGWSPTQPLRMGIEKTYKWIKDQLV